MSDLPVDDTPLSEMDDNDLAELFGAVVAEIASRTEMSEPETMFHLAANFWSETDLRKDWPYNPPHPMQDDEDGQK